MAILNRYWTTLSLNKYLSTLGQSYKTFYGRNLQVFVKKLECLSLASLASLV
jgi:hypothetical protein